MPDNSPAAAAAIPPSYFTVASNDPYEEVPRSEKRVPILLAVPGFDRNAPGVFRLDGELLLAFTHDDPDRDVVCNRCWGARSFASHGQHKDRCYRDRGGENSAKSMLHPSFDWESETKKDSMSFWKDLKSAENFEDVRPGTRKGRHEEVWLVRRANRTAYFVDPKTEFSGVCTYCFKICSWNRIVQHMEEHQLLLNAAKGNAKYRVLPFNPVTVNRDELKKKDDGDDDSFADKSPSKKKKKRAKATGAKKKAETATGAKKAKKTKKKAETTTSDDDASSTFGIEEAHADDEKEDDEVVTEEATQKKKSSSKKATKGPVRRSTRNRKA